MDDPSAEWVARLCPPSISGYGLLISKEGGLVLPTVFSVVRHNVLFGFFPASGDITDLRFIGRAYLDGRFDYLVLIE